MPARPVVRPHRSDASRLRIYMTAVSLLGLPIALWACLDFARTGTTLDPALLGLLIAVLVAGELLPIHISRPGRRTDEITISTTFALALLFIAPLGVVLLAQALPLMVDDLRRRKHWTRVLFNIAQYALTFSAARGTYCLLTGQEFLVPTGLGDGDLLAAFLAGVAFFTVNHVSVDAAVALSTGERVLPHLVRDLRFQLSTSGLLVCLAPLVVVASSFSLALLPVLLLPLAAVRHSAELASQREHDALTGLPNRAHLHFELGRALDDAQRSGGGVVVAWPTWTTSRRSTTRWATRWATGSSRRSRTGSRPPQARTCSSPGSAATSSRCSPRCRTRRAAAAPRATSWSGSAPRCATR